MRLLALSSLILTGTLASTAFADQNELLNYNIINISAEASRDISNDLMHANLYVEKSNKQPAELAAQINQLMNQAINAAKKYPSVKIETGSQHTYPVYDNDNRKLREWRARAQVRIESTDFKAASQLIAELQQNFQTESINFSVSEAKRKKVENELMLEASKNFQQRAQSLAQAWNKAGYQLVNMNINTNNSGYPPVPRMAMAKSAYAEAAIPDQEMAAGESKMTVSANGSIQFK
ncbi:SIMPL domain-containing protein [Acinetobacter schindleri]|uniref:SIMPL domain-containing protein n=1 Tax=Acinetobacter schindleri TaxID=108981 RepID=UPI002DBB1A2F|nr:SIMPL domain-containing protein [Acinetobacter schindleri]MEB5929510.1 SIMPL domain-containing protein [Acinetobacter schindleri]